MKNVFVIGFSIIVLLLGIPMSFQAVYSAQENVSKQIEQVDDEYEEMFVPVFREALNEHQDLLLEEEYLIGVVAAEMPATFELEALKAQAITARTYTLKTLESEPFILDTVQHQAFKDHEQLKERWGTDFDEYYHKIRQAVEETRGLVLTHDGSLIRPLFFALSNGKTENSEDYFSEEVPYLRVVDSEWDKSVAGFVDQKTFEISELRDIFNDSSLTHASFNIISRTEGGNIQEVAVGNDHYSGREFREKLGLRSSDFSFSFEDDIIIVTTYGYGHGVGMSQTGANELAKMDKDYQDILEHYYQNIKIIEKNFLY